MVRKVLYIGCKRTSCAYNDPKLEKCTRTVIMHDENGRCKSYDDPTEFFLVSWWKRKRGKKK